MAIVGHGVDIVEVPRIARMLDEHGERFLERCFTAMERETAKASGRPSEHLAGRFAAKEAVMKCLGTGWSAGVSWTDIEVRADASGRPMVVLSGGAAQAAQRIGAGRWWLSITHVESHAIASAIAEQT